MLVCTTSKQFLAIVLLVILPFIQDSQTRRTSEIKESKLDQSLDSI